MLYKHVYILFKLRKNYNLYIKKNRKFMKNEFMNNYKFIRLRFLDCFKFYKNFIIIFLNNIQKIYSFSKY